VKIVFGEHVLDPDRRELTRGSEAIAVGPQVFDVLVHLVRNRERVVTKDDLIDVIWGGRIVSESTLTSHINAVRKAIGDSGEEQRLVRTIARKGYRFVGEVRQSDAFERADPAKRHEPLAQALALSDRPSIAALPFLNLSGDPTQDYFVDGLVEDIIVALSRMRWLFVIARNSSFTYKGRVVDPRQVGRELGVRYVLEGSVRKAANRVRITGQLIDASTGTNLWSERFEGKIDNIFELQDEMTANVVGAIAPQLQRVEIERAKQKPTESLGAYDYYLRGMANLHFGTREAVDEALRLFYKAIELDPEYAAAYGAAAWCHLWRKINGWISDRARSSTRERDWPAAPSSWARMMRSPSCAPAPPSPIWLATSMAASPCLTGRRYSIPVWRLPGSSAGSPGSGVAIRMARSRTSRRRCVSARWTRRCTACRPEWRQRTCLPSASTKPHRGPRSHSGICRPFS
jgi:TolB-like protein